MNIAFVVQRYGEEVNGGAELLCRWVAQRLSAHHDVHVLTTCAQDFKTWENTYPAGTRALNDVHVHRFPVDQPRHWKKFQRLTHRILTEEHSYLEELDWMRQQGPISTPLLLHIETHRETYDAFIFVTYLYATTYYGLQLVPEKALLVPTAHEEPPLYLTLFRSLFQLPRHIIYSTHAEQRLVERVFKNSSVPSSVIGTGVEVPADVEPDRFRRKYGIDGEFVLYAGRIDEAKNVPELFNYFKRFKKTSSVDIRLVLIGKGLIPGMDHPDIISLGFVPEEDKFDAMQAATLLLLPSKYESLSIAILEAWMMGTPVLVNGECEVLREQCIRSNGGLFYANYPEFALALRALLQKPQLRRTLGRQGREYAEATYSWDTVIEKYSHAIVSSLPTSTKRSPIKRTLVANVTL